MVQIINVFFFSEQTFLLHCSTPYEISRLRLKIGLEKRIFRKQWVLQRRSGHCLLLLTCFSWAEWVYEEEAEHCKKRSKMHDCTKGSLAWAELLQYGYELLLNWTTAGFGRALRLVRTYSNMFSAEIATARDVCLFNVARASFQTEGLAAENLRCDRNRRRPLAWKNVQLLFCDAWSCRYE